MMSLKDKIQSEEDYELVLREIARYFENEPALGTPEAARFNELAEMLTSYEAKHWPITRTAHKS
ncbi:MAG: hypothetical protein P4L57_04495 [Rhizomicrobium sp.]|nr:hypothetical protein [Rhizomicrobium sp.]